jgi:hypothetical protein
MADDKSTFNLGIAAWKDMAKERYIRMEGLLKGIKPPFDVDIILAEIKKGVELCNSWKFEELHLSG